MREIKFKVEISLPVWCQDYVSNLQNKTYSSDVDKMNFVLSMLEKHLDNKSGGPFAAAIFDESESLISIGLNTVVTSNDSTAHAEISAFRLAQKTLGTYSFNTLGNFTLCTSAQPCSQCFGASIWAGISKIIIGVSAKKTESLGFDEGPIPSNWREEYKKRGIQVVEGVLEDKAFELMQKYDGNIYNGKIS